MSDGASPSGDRAVAPSASSPQAVSPVPASIPSAIKRAGIGTLMFRRSDVLHEISRLNRHARIAMDTAKNEGRLDDAEVHATRMRAAASLLDRIFLHVPVFENASAIEARRAGTEGSGAQHESAVPKADAQEGGQP